MCPVMMASPTLVLLAVGAPALAGLASMVLPGRRTLARPLVAAAGPVFVTIENGRGLPVKASKAVLERALKNHFDSIRPTEPVDEAQRIATRDAIVGGLLDEDVLPTWTRLPPMSWPEELLDQARDIGTRGPDPLSPSLFDERWAESWVDRWALISKNGAVPDLIKKEIRKIKDEEGIIPQ